MFDPIRRDRADAGEEFKDKHPWLTTDTSRQRESVLADCVEIGWRTSGTASRHGQSKVRKRGWDAGHDDDPNLRRAAPTSAVETHLLRVVAAAPNQLNELRRDPNDATKPFARFWVGVAKVLSRRYFDAFDVLQHGFSRQFLSSDPLGPGTSLRSCAHFQLFAPAPVPEPRVKRRTRNREEVTRRNSPVKCNLLRRNGSVTVSYATDGARGWPWTALAEQAPPASVPSRITQAMAWQRSLTRPSRPA
jgi:hypothetical protein